MKFIIPMILLQIVTCVFGANILFFFGSSGYSHRISVWPLIEKLAENGHKITFLSPYYDKVPKPKNPNIYDFTIKGHSEALGLMSLDFVTLRLQHGITAIDKLWWFYYEAGINSCKFLMKNDEFKQWVSKSSFDLIVIGSLFNECAYGLVHKFNAPVIMYSPTAHFQWFKEAYGLPDENFSEVETHYTKNPTFLQRVKNLLVPLYWQAYRQWDLFPKLEKMLKDNLMMSDLPSLSSIERNTSLIIVSQHFSEEYPRSLPPNFVYIGGIHCTDKRNPLPQDVTDFLTTANEGFIYLSFGTFATLHSLPKYLQEIFFKSVGKFPKIKFLIKYTGDAPKDIPKNIKFVAWINQQDILAHPKIRGFIGHGGLLGIQEAIYFGIPMIILPLFAEQDYNAVRAHERETGISLEIADLTEMKLVNAINGILHDKKYKENSMKLSSLFRDRPEFAIDKAVWWMEYVLRHKNDISHLQPVGVTRTWYQRRMLDIWGFLTLTLIIILSIAWFVLRKIITLLVGKREKSKSD